MTLFSKLYQGHLVFALRYSWVSHVGIGKLFFNLFPFRVFVNDSNQTYKADYLQKIVRKTPCIHVKPTSILINAVFVRLFWQIVNHKAIF